MILPDCPVTQDLERMFGELLGSIEPPKKPNPDATPIPEWRAKPGKEL